MRKWPLFIFFCFTQISFAQMQEPQNWCAYSCGESQQEIWNKFNAARFDSVGEEPVLYSGQCFHLGGGYNKDYAHHGVFYFSQVVTDSVSSTHASGSFMFFGNGYDNMTLEEAQESFKKHANSNHRLMALEQSATLDFSVDDEIVRYWFRHSEDRTQVYLLGQWGLDHHLFCQLNKK
ncbi:MAG: hypothetical protein KDD22_06840 [Bdellovibrionales bacterium]|nr:hypothetical protein [Bdellovibrionales bacterium]